MKVKTLVYDTMDTPAPTDEAQVNFSEKSDWEVKICEIRSRSKIRQFVENSQKHLVKEEAIDHDKSRLMLMCQSEVTGIREVK